jgi:hypothetical protein
VTRTRHPAAAGAALAFLAAGCLTRITDDDRTEVEFWGTVSAETEAAVRALDDQARGEFVAALPEARLETTWRGVLDILDDVSSLEPMADRIRALVDQEIDASVRVELATPSGDAHLRHLILTSIDTALAAPRGSG